MIKSDLRKQGAKLARLIAPLLLGGCASSVTGQPLSKALSDTIASWSVPTREQLEKGLPSDVWSETWKGPMRRVSRPNIDKSVVAFVAEDLKTIELYVDHRLNLVLPFIPMWSSTRVVYTRDGMVRWRTLSLIGPFVFSKSSKDGENSEAFETDGLLVLYALVRSPFRTTYVTLCGLGPVLDIEERGWRLYPLGANLASMAVWTDGETPTLSWHGPLEGYFGWRSEVDELRGEYPVGDRRIWLLGGILWYTGAFHSIDASGQPREDRCLHSSLGTMFGWGHDSSGRFVRLFFMNFHYDRNVEDGNDPTASTIDDGIDG